MSLSVPLDKGDRVRAGNRIGRLDCSVFILHVYIWVVVLGLGETVCFISIWIAFGDKC